MRPTQPSSPPTAFAPERWAQLAASVGIDPEAPIVVALSGGADSVHLLQVLAAARPRPRILAAHVDHGLRGADSDADSEFCAHAASELDVEFVRERIELDPRPEGLEQRSRTARYRALACIADRAAIDVIATGHHADDSLETLLLRWTRGSELSGFAGVPPRTRLRPAGATAGDGELNPTPRELFVVRPLHALRREEVREALRAMRIEWREDASNRSATFARNRLRHGLLPALESACSPAALEHLREFARCVDEFESRCARWTAPIVWSPPRLASARRAANTVASGGSLERAQLTRLPSPLQRRALARLFLEGTGRFQSRASIERVLALLADGGTGEITLGGGWRLAARREWLHLDPPRLPQQQCARVSAERQLELAFDAARVGLELDVPGRAVLADGRAITASIFDSTAERDVPRSAERVELDADGIEGPLVLRFPRPGDRFHPLGAPGSRPLGRFLRDAGISRHDREHVALVCAGTEVLWIAGLRPSEPRRIRHATTRRLRLELDYVRAPGHGPGDLSAASG